AAIIAAWYQLAPCPPAGPPGDSPAGSPTLAATLRAPNRACPANHPTPAVNTVTCAIAGMPEPQDHDMPIITAHMTACSPAPTAGTSRRRRPAGISSRPAAARYHAPRPATKADSTQREASFPNTAYPFAGKGIAYLTATIINATIQFRQV